MKNWFYNSLGMLVIVLVLTEVEVTRGAEVEETPHGSASFSAEGPMQGDFEGLARVLITEASSWYMMIQITDSANQSKSSYRLEFIVKSPDELGLPPVGSYQPVEGKYAQDGYNGNIGPNLRLRVNPADAEQYQAVLLESDHANPGSVEITQVEDNWVYGTFEVQLKQNGSMNGGDIGDQRVKLYNGTFKAPLQPDSWTW